MSPMTEPTLKSLLEETIERCSRVERRDKDPVGKVHPYKSPRDQEVAALFASCLAYGRVDLLRPAIDRALAPLGETPSTTLRDVDAGELATLWPDFTYRMSRGPDIADLAVAIGRTLRREGDLQSLYLHGRRRSAPITGFDEHTERASHFVQKLRSRRLRPELHRGFRYLLPDPADGSACKRLHLFFRWMVRPADGIDLGLWNGVSPRALLMPLDTHTSRLCRYLGLLKRKSVDGKAARKVTERLAELDENDPLRFDFALCHLGISGQCIHRRSPDHCPSCPIESACILPDET